PKVAKLNLIASRVEPLEWLEKEIQVDFALAPELMRIVLKGHDTEELKVLITAIQEAYFREVLDKERIGRRERLNLLVTLREQYEQKLRASKEAQKELLEKLPSSNADLRGRYLSFLQQQLAATQTDLIRVNSKLLEAKPELVALQAREGKLSELRVPEAEVL